MNSPSPADFGVKPGSAMSKEKGMEVNPVVTTSGRSAAACGYTAIMWRKEKRLVCQH